MDNNERDRLLAERRVAMMESDFDPKHTPERAPAADIRIAVALEYIAFQLGQMNRKMDTLIEADSKSAEALRGLRDGFGTFLVRTKF